MIRKLIWMVSMFGILCLAGVYAGRFLFPQVVESSSKIFCYESVGGLCAAADCIAEVQAKVKRSNVVFFTEDQCPYGGYTLTTVKVLKVYSGDRKLENTEIIVREPSYEIITPFGRFLCTNEGYLPLERNRRVLLFLRENSGDYSIVGDFQGKFSLTEDGMIDDVESATRKELDIGEYGHIEYYKKLYREVKDYIG